MRTSGTLYFNFMLYAHTLFRPRFAGICFRSSDDIATKQYRWVAQAFVFVWSSDRHECVLVSQFYEQTTKLSEVQLRNRLASYR